LEPAHLGGQPADLCVQFLELALMGDLFRSLLFMIRLEQIVQVIDGLLFPAVQLVGMDTVLGSDLSDGSLFFENLEHDLGLLLGRKASSHGSQPTLFQPLFVSNFP